MATSIAAALGGAAVFLLSALDPLREAAPWVLPLLAAGSGAAAGLALLSVWRAARRPAGRDEHVSHPVPPPVLPSVPGPTAAAPPSPATIAPVIIADEAVRIAALEEALRQKDRLTVQRLRSQQIAAMDARADLASAIVHDMNNVLGAVSGYADFLVSDLPAGSPQADYANRTVAAIARARPGLRRLVSAARTESVALKPERAGGVLDEAAALLRAVPVAPGSLAVRQDAGTPDALCNADLLARTMAGLAAEILAVGGRGSDARLCLRASACTPSAAEQGDPDADAAAAGWTVRPLLTPHPEPHTLFELRIDGAPLADDALAALVDPLLFARARHRRGQLDRDERVQWPAALLVARLHDGGLSLLTHPAEGTAVRLHIPAAPLASRSSLAPPQASSQFNPVPNPVSNPIQGPAKHRVAPAYKVLVVDADPASGDRFQTGLEGQGLEVSVCDDLRDALDVVTDEPGFFDAVVIGPGLSALPAGVALACRLKALRSDLPCVLYGPESLRADAALGRDRADGPADLLLPLPVDLPRLARGVAALAAGGSRYGAAAGGDNDVGQGGGQGGGLGGEPG